MTTPMRQEVRLIYADWQRAV